MRFFDIPDFSRIFSRPPWVLPPPLLLPPRLNGMGRGEEVAGECGFLEDDDGVQQEVLTWW